MREHWLVSRVKDAQGKLLIAIVLASLALVVYLGNASFVYPSGDVVPTSVLPFSILVHHDFLVGRYLYSNGQSVPYYILPFRSDFISAYPIGTALTSIPFYIPYVIFGGQLSVQAGAVIGKLSASIITAVSVFLFYLLLSKLNLSLGIRVLFTSLFAFGTETFSIGSQGLWQHGAAEMWLVLFLLSVYPMFTGTVQSRKESLLTGLSMGMVLLCRPDDIILTIPFGIYFFVKKYWRSIPYITLGFLPLLFGLFIYNNHYFGNPFNTGYGNSGHVMGYFSFPLLDGLLGNLFSPSKGLFIFMPWAIIALFWGSYLFKREFYKSFYAPTFIALCPYIILYAKFYQWPAGYSFGPRYMTDISPFIVILVAGRAHGWFDHNKGRVRLVTKMGVLVSLGIWSIWVQMLGTYTSNGGAWNAAAHPNHFWRPLWSLRGSEIAYYWHSAMAAGNAPTPLTSPKANFLSLDIYSKPYIYSAGLKLQKYLPNTTYQGTALVENTGNSAWSAYPGPNGDNVVHFSYTVWKDGKKVVADGTRSALLHSVGPHQKILIYFNLQTPKQPGEYTYVFTLVDEGITWFQNGTSAQNAYVKTINVQSLHQPQ